MNTSIFGCQQSKLKRQSAIKRLLRQFIHEELMEQDDEVMSLVRDIKRARNEWLNACYGYEFAKEQVVIDYYIYNMKACQIKYEYLLSIAKEKRVRLEQYDILDIAVTGS